MSTILSNIYNTVKHLPTAAPSIKAMAVADAIVTGVTANAGAQSAGTPGAIIMGGIFAAGCLTVTSLMDAHERAHRGKPRASAPTIGNGPA